MCIRDSPKISEILLSGIAISLADSGNIELASKFFLYTDASKYLFRNKDILIKILPCLLLSSFFDEVIDLVINHTNDREDNLLDLPVLMSSMLLRHNTPKFEKSVESFLLKSLEKYKQKKWRDLYGQTHYNLANHYRSRSMYKAALHNFIEAKKNDSSYLKRDYFYREVAGTLFELGRYKLSSVCYEKAIELGNRNEDNALYADALMHQGQYDEAIKYFSKYLKGTESPTPYWILKYIFLDSFTENSKPLSQRRKPKQASRHVNISLPDLDLEQNLEEALKLDSLCALAWFNLGIYGRDKENYESASYCFMASSILCPQDIESWVNCTLSAFKTGNLSLVPHVIHSAYYFNKEHYLSALYQSLKDIPNNLKESLYMIIESLIKDFGEGHDERELRFISPDNKSAKTMRIKIPQN
jgi:tetratricopeptide (TPR) repeat protein